MGGGRTNYLRLKLTVQSPNTLVNNFPWSKYHLYQVTHVTQAFGRHKTGI